MKLRLPLLTLMFAPSICTAGRGDEAPTPYIIGADISWVQQQEDAGVHFSDQGSEKDVLEILKDHGFNWIRLRIFCNPRAERGYSKAGYCDLEHTLQMAQRVNAAGMKLLLDFHYSDTWADPGHQTKPAAWATLHGEDLQNAVRVYTKEVLSKLKDQGTLPDMVQIGNEISSGLLWPDGQIGKTGNWDAFCELLEAGIAGVKDVDGSVRIMLHLACGGQNARSRDFLDRVLARGVKFDVIGQSYYPKWHGTLAQLKANLTDLAGRYHQPVIVVEYTAPDIGEINQIVQDLPHAKGLGTFIWEPTRWGPAGGALFDRQGRTKPEIDVYPEIGKRSRTARP